MALRHTTCVGTVMVIQDSAAPLTRSWCLFEVLQTFLLQKERGQDFRGLFLVTHSGVLNSGAAPVDVVMKIAIKVVTVFFEDAQATRASDKEMIDDAVKKDSGFTDLNKYLREHMRDAVLNGKQRFDEKVMQILSRLNVVDRLDDGAPSGTISCPFSAFCASSRSPGSSPLGDEGASTFGLDRTRALPLNVPWDPHSPELLDGELVPRTPVRDLSKSSNRSSVPPEPPEHLD